MIQQKLFPSHDYSVKYSNHRIAHEKNAVISLTMNVEYFQDKLANSLSFPFLKKKVQEFDFIKT